MYWSHLHTILWKINSNKAAVCTYIIIDIWVWVGFLFVTTFSTPLNKNFETIFCLFLRCSSARSKFKHSTPSSPSTYYVCGTLSYCNYLTQYIISSFFFILLQTKLHALLFYWKIIGCNKILTNAATGSWETVHFFSVLIFSWHNSIYWYEIVEEKRQFLRRKILLYIAFQFRPLRPSIILGLESCVHFVVQTIYKKLKLNHKASFDAKMMH